MNDGILVDESRYGEATDEIIFRGIVENVKDSNRHKRVIYVSIGSASHMGTIKDNKKIVEPMYMHQFPPTLSELELKHPDATFQIILIDPLMESVPYITTDESGLKQSDNFIKSDDNVELYKHRTANKTVYVIRKYASYMGNVDERYCDISSLLNDLIALSIRDETLFIFNDFSGRSSNELIEYYDKQKAVKEHLNHIIIGLTMRTDYGCYIDLTNDMCKFAYMADVDRIRVFNPYFYLLNNIDVDTCGVADDIDDDGTKIMITQMNGVFETNKKIIKDGLLSVYRRTHMLAKGKPIDFDKYELSKYNEKFGTDLQKIYEDGKHVELNDLIRAGLINECDKITKLHKINCDGITMFTIITMDESPYNWGTSYDTFFEMM